MLTAVMMLALMIAGLTAEAIVVRRRVSSIRVRVHVGGTRGKSSVVRYIAAALRDNGYRVLGKVTGEVPTLLLPDGTTTLLHRRGPARVQEQVHVIRLARTLSCDAIVLECMSLNPFLQTLESRILRPTLSVLTNILDDHREEFGPSSRDQAEAVCAFFPADAPLISHERVYADVVAACAAHASTRVVQLEAAEGESASGLPPGVHAENVELALAACTEMGCERGKALEAILGEARRMRSPLSALSTPRGSLQFLDGFAVNDVTSARRFLEQWRSSVTLGGPIAIILNTRADRPLRSVQFAQWCGTLTDLERVVVTGTHRARTRCVLRESGVDACRITVWSSGQARDPVNALAQLRLSEGCLVVGLGNIAGDGFAILKGIRQ
jgi:poly-gamma-glutamate synthase PgsB/CapB